jgi:hypothetical protein
MMRSISTGRLLWFPLSTPVPEAAAQNWNLRILETKDNLENALNYLRDEYNAMLAGEPVTAADEILARVETIQRNSREVSRWTIVPKIRVHEPTLARRETKGPAALSPFETAAVKASKESMPSCITIGQFLRSHRLETWEVPPRLDERP